MRNRKFNMFYVGSVLVTLLYVSMSCGVNQAFQVGDKEVFVLEKKGYMTDVKELQKGYKMYVSRCGNCHALIEPSKYTLAEWDKKYLPVEFEKSKVEKEDEKKLISYYIYAKAK